MNHLHRLQTSISAAVWQRVLLSCRRPPVTINHANNWRRFAKNSCRVVVVDYPSSSIITPTVPTELCEAMPGAHCTSCSLDWRRRSYKNVSTSEGLTGISPHHQVLRHGVGPPVPTIRAE